MEPLPASKIARIFSTGQIGQGDRWGCARNLKEEKRPPGSSRPSAAGKLLRHPHGILYSPDHAGRTAGKSPPSGGLLVSRVAGRAAQYSRRPFNPGIGTG